MTLRPVSEQTLTQRFNEETATSTVEATLKLEGDDRVYRMGPWELDDRQTTALSTLLTDVEHFLPQVSELLLPAAIRKG